MSRTAPEAASSGRRRVLLLETNEDGTVGGSHQCLYDLVKGLDRGRFEPLVLFYQDNPFVDRLDGLCAVEVWADVRRSERRRVEGGGPVAHALALPGAVLRRRRFIARRGIDLVHLNNSPVSGFDDWLPAARLAGVPCVSHARGHYTPPSRTLEGLLVRRYDRVVAMSEHIRRRLVDAGLPPEKVERVYGSIDADEFRQQLCRTASEVRAELGVPEHGLLIVMVGHVREWKGQHVVLEALDRLEPSLRDRIHVAFAGAFPDFEAPYRDRLESFVRDRGLDDRVRFLGPRDDVPDLLRAADVAVHASTRPEPFGLVVLEAMAAGTPLVASERGGPGEILGDGSGLTFDPDYPEQLADHLVRLGSDPALRERLSKMAATRLEDFGHERMVREVEAIWGELLGLGVPTPDSAAGTQVAPPLT